MDRLLRGLEVDPGIRRQPQADLGAAAQHLAAEDGAQPREQRAQRRVRAGGRAPRPERLDQLVAPRRERAVDGEVGEQHARLTAREPPGQLAPGELDGEPAAQLDSGGGLVRQRSLQGESQNFANRRP